LKEEVVEYKTFEDRIISVANQLASEVYFRYKKYRPIGINNFKNKYFKYFSKAAEMFSTRQDFDVEKFVSAQYEKYAIFYPQQISSESAWKTYQEHKDLSLKDSSEERQLALELTSTHGLMRKKTVKQFFENKMNILKLRNGQLNDRIKYFCFSKYFCFILLPEHLEKLEKPFDIKICKIRVREYPRLIKWLQEKLGEDYYDN
jgi:hypothetical protein